MSKEVCEDFVPIISHCVLQKSHQDWWTGRRFVDNNELVYIVGNKACYSINDQTHDLQAGDLLCLTSGMFKKTVTHDQPPLHCYSVNFDSYFPVSKPVLSSFPAVNHIGMRKDLTDLFRDLTSSWTNKHNGYIVKTRALLMLILQRLSEILIYNINAQTGDHRINNAIQPPSRCLPGTLAQPG